MYFVNRRHQAKHVPFSSVSGKFALKDNPIRVAELLTHDLSLVALGPPNRSAAADLATFVVVTSCAFARERIRLFRG